ncbi:SemiSWEET transporter [Massilia sp. TS11]|uniref:SemiSWEET transporter n=1 Tax=Massilia sp. TS11 TaxID=2908003 RepID=UPI001EDB4205|nr:SemiSWEET transporter [Massilia sp. TS11]MCG2585261.1 SemiSWEET transporter [Massilia sp. TS11]
MNIELLGFLAACCTTFSFLPQVWLVWKRRSAEGVSLGMYLIFTIGVALWFLYGLLIGAWPVILANGVTLILAGTVLVMKWLFDRQR